MIKKFSIPMIVYKNIPERERERTGLKNQEVLN